jgi:hypothetical protein
VWLSAWSVAVIPFDEPDTTGSGSGGRTGAAVVVVVGVVDPPPPVCDEEPPCGFERPDFFGDDDPLPLLCEEEEFDEDPRLFEDDDDPPVELEFEDPPEFALEEPLPLPDDDEDEDEEPDPDDGADAPPELFAEWCDAPPACLPCALERPCELPVLTDAPAVVFEVASAPWPEPPVVLTALLLPHAVNPADASRPVTSAVARLA